MKADTPWALVLADGKPGHENQSLGVLPHGIKPWRFQVSYRSKAARGAAWLAARWPVPFAPLAGAFPWRRVMVDGDELVHRLNAAPRPALVISSGSGPAPMTLLLARELGRPAVTCMTPSVGVSRFDLALVPRHDRPPDLPTVVSTLGAPNRVNPETLTAEADAFRTRHDLPPGDYITLLLGGDSAHHRIPAALGVDILDQCLTLSRETGMTLLVTTSRRTREETETAMAERAGETGFFCRGRTDLEPVLAGMLGLAKLVVVTEDSVSMVSEAASSPARVLTVAVERVGDKVPRRHEAVLSALAEGGFARRANPAALAGSGRELLDGVPPPMLDDSEVCRRAVTELVDTWTAR